MNMSKSSHSLGEREGKDKVINLISKDSKRKGRKMMIWSIILMFYFSIVTQESLHKNCIHSSNKHLSEYKPYYRNTILKKRHNASVHSTLEGQTTNEQHNVEQ